MPIVVFYFYHRIKNDKGEDADGNCHKSRMHLLGSAVPMLLLLLLPFFFRIPPHGPPGSLLKPLILQELAYKRSVSRVELHNLKYKGFILVTDLSFTEMPEWFQLLRRHRRHDANDCFLGVLVSDLFIGDRKRPEPLMLVHDDSRIVHFMAFWLFRLEDVEVETPYEVDKLGKHQLPDGWLSGSGQTSCNAETPDVCSSIPWHFKMDLRSTKKACSSWCTMRREF